MFKNKTQVKSRHAKPQKSKKLITLSVLSVLFITLLGFFLYNQTKTYPLGTDGKLEYIGKEDYGCILPICDSKPYSVYYYGTDMTVEEVIGYFKGAEEFSRPAKESSGIRIWLMDKKTKENFIMSYYAGDGILKDKGIKLTRKNAIGVSSYNYSIARNAL